MEQQTSSAVAARADRPSRENLLATGPAATRLGVCVQTLNAWRIRGIGPRYLKLGAAVRYDPADLDAYLAACARTSTSRGVRGVNARKTAHPGTDATVFVRSTELATVAESPTAKSPAFQFYPDEFLALVKVRLMTTEEKGVYLLLLLLDWQETGFVFHEPDLAQWCGLSRKRFAKAWSHFIKDCFVERDGRLYNPRLEREREKQRRFRERCVEGGRSRARQRWGKPDSHTNSQDDRVGYPEAIASE